jgi:hypothetical protein
VIDEAMRRLKLLTEELDIHLMLIVHPSKTDDGKNGKLAKLTMNSGKGASSIVQECDNYLTVERREQDGRYYCEVTVHKNRAMAYVGKATFAVGDNRNTYTECTEGLPDAPRTETDWIGRVDN